MNAMRKLLSFLMIGILTAFLVWGVSRPVVTDSLSILRHGYGARDYLAAAAGGGTVCLASRAGDGFRLTLGTLQGRRTGERRVELETSAADCTLAGLFPAPDDSVFLGVYEPAETRTAGQLALYRVPAQGQPERLLLHACQGESARERMASSFLSGFTAQEDGVQFALITGGDVQLYRYNGTESGLEQGTAVRVGSPVTAAAVFEDGTIALGGNSWLALNGRQANFSLENCIVTQFIQVGAGFCYLDSASLKVFYSDLTGTEQAQLRDIGGMGLEGSFTSLSLARNGDVLMLRDGRTLELLHDGGVTGLHSVAYRSAVQCVLILAGLLLVWLLLTLLVWYWFCGRQQSYMPFAVRTSGILAVFALLCGTILQYAVVQPLIRETVYRELDHAMTSVVALTLGQSPAGQLPEAASTVLDELFDGDQTAITVSAAVYGREQRTDEITGETTDKWTLYSSEDALPAGSCAVLSDGFSAPLAEQAVALGRASEGDRNRFRLYFGAENSALRLTISGSALEDQIITSSRQLLLSLWAGAGLLWLCATIALLLAGQKLKRIGQATEQMSAGKTDMQMQMRTGDEFESLANTLNSLARSMQRQEIGKADLIRAYLRFVPERVLNLLGKESILDVDKHTFASRRMAAMKVWFEFPEVSGGSVRTLFDSINEVIERTAAIVSRKNGAVFNFAHNGYDVVLDGGEDVAVSTAVAVQQEVLSFNDQRREDGLPGVTLRIALDLGEVMIGIVGDETQMEPTTISASFTTARRLIGLAEQLEAGILCTETIIAGAQHYNSRYMGKSRQNDGFVRVYEIFDGDPYQLRQSKESAAPRFAQGIFALYSQDIATAKRIFLELVHENPQDGGARYYLYLADRLEKQPGQEISLECGEG